MAVFVYAMIGFITFKILNEHLFIFDIDDFDCFVSAFWPVGWFGIAAYYAGTAIVDFVEDRKKNKRIKFAP